MSKLSKSQKPSSKNSHRVCPRCKGRGWLNKSHYSKGRQFEYKVRDFLTERGWKVTRSYGSKGVFDLIAESRGTILGIQVKNLTRAKNKAYLTVKDMTGLTHEILLNKTALPPEYVMWVWVGMKQPPKQVMFHRPIRVIHAYNEDGEIHWRELVDLSEWRDCSNLIKHKK